MIAGLIISAAAQNWMDSRPRKPGVYEDVLYLYSGETLKRASIGFDGLMADIYWIRTLLYFGENVERQRRENNSFDSSRLSLLGPMVNITVELDPRFIAAYRFGAIFLPDAGPETAVRFVERGIRNNPEEWRLYQDLAFVYWRQNRYREAADAYARGSRLPGAPAWMQAMSPVMLVKGGDRETAREMFLRLCEESDDPFIRQVCEEQLDLLDQWRGR
jgi:hypothetical protein